MTVNIWVTAVAALVAAALSGLGVGSAGIFVLYLTFIAGYSQPEAQGANLLFFLLSAGSALFFHARRRNIPWRAVAVMVLAAVPGAVLGTWLLRRLDADVVRRLFGGMLIIAGALSLRAGRTGERSGERSGELLARSSPEPPQEL